MHQIITCIFLRNPGRSMLRLPELSDQVGSRSRSGKIVRIRNWDRIRPFWHKNLNNFFANLYSRYLRAGLRIRHFNAEPDPASTLLRIRIHFQFNADPDPDPAPFKSDGNLRPLVYRPSRGLYFEPPGLYRECPRSSTALYLAAKVV